MGHLHTASLSVGDGRGAWSCVSGGDGDSGPDAVTEDGTEEDHRAGVGRRVAPARASLTKSALKASALALRLAR